VGIVLGIIQFVITLGITAATGGTIGQPNNSSQVASLLLLAVGLIFNILQLAVDVWYLVFFQAKKGQTLGKKAVGIKVVDRNGNKPSLGTFAIRELVGKWILDTITLGIGYLIVAFDSKKQGLHDKIANTFVVKV
jgi:uncharacterized RDD family membrane protein YckC